MAVLAALGKATKMAGKTDGPSLELLKALTVRLGESDEGKGRRVRRRQGRAQDGAGEGARRQGRQGQRAELQHVHQLWRRGGSA